MREAEVEAPVSGGPELTEIPPQGHRRQRRLSHNLPMLEISLKEDTQVKEGAAQ
jgi:hypothetical protein